MKRCYGLLLLTWALLSPIMAKQHTPPSPVSLLHLSIFSEYTYFDLDQLDESAAQDKLEMIFYDKLDFVKRHDARKFIIKVLDPARYPFFEPSRFSASKPDNFFYFLTHLLESVEVEVLFDETPFSWDYPEGNRLKVLEESLEPMPGFESFMDKILYFNRLLSEGERAAKTFSITDMVIAPQKPLKQSTLQAVINNFDRYRFSPLCSLAPTHLGLAMKLEITDKELALAGLASFPLHNDLREDEKSLDIGITLPDNFPSSEPHFASPSWRAKASMADRSLPLLSYVYLNLGSQKLAKEVYHDRQTLPLPSQYTPTALPQLASRMQSIFRAEPYTQGPGYFSAYKDATLIKGRYTFFRDGSKEGYGQLIEGQKVGIYREGSSEMLIRKLKGAPENNTTLTLNAPLSFDTDLSYHPYYYSPFPVNWSTPRLSRCMASKLFYLFDVSYAPGCPMAQGDWHLVNFLHFLINTREKTGFLYTKLFYALDGVEMSPNNNVVISDYSGLPNGEPYEEINWHLGNSSFKD